MSRSWLLSIPVAATLSLGAIAIQFDPIAAQAQSYPRTIGSGESAEIDYGPGTRGNIIGGGSLTASGYGENYAAAYLDPRSLQQPRSGLVPMSISDGNESRTVWVPAGTDPRSLFSFNADGASSNPRMPAVGTVAATGRATRN